MADLDALLADFADESAELERLVAPLDPAGWQRPTPAPGWTIAHQIGHLAWTDGVATRSATDPDGFARMLIEAAPRVTTFVDEGAEEAAAAPPAVLLRRWREGRAALVAALRAVPEGAKVPWFGPPMRPGSMITARLMETWAHGQDVADALGVTREPTHRLRAVAHIGARTRDFAYTVHGRTPPAAEFRIELTAPDGALWSWGPADAEQRITAPALDFCLLVTQRRHPDDLAVRVTGADAAEWLTIAQAFAGPSGAGRAKGQFG
ncbi:TIGR03084 family metal-binding protein [Nocardia asteroides]|uniref:TIGR03084 family metal-binding protein n=1 Tax=Nocardia asteroides TaxID=1824 RepID=UPI001E61AC30|nr:TIGR03084 family metal-binding protein [Nocardia asteroides]UGT59243.1 TIGR03084 family metal-binding protein [Nocardia asteroides]